MQSDTNNPRLMLNLDYLHKNYVAVGFGEILRDVLQAFHEQAQQNLQTILKAQAEGNFTVVSETAHTLKGSAGSVGAFRLAEAAEELEEAAKKRHQSATNQLINKLNTRVQATLNAVTLVLEQPASDQWPSPF